MDVQNVSTLVETLREMERDPAGRGNLSSRLPAYHTKVAAIQNQLEVPTPPEYVEPSESGSTVNAEGAECGGRAAMVDAVRSAARRAIAHPQTPPLPSSSTPDPRCMPTCLHACLRAVTLCRYPPVSCCCRFGTCLECELGCMSNISRLWGLLFQMCHPTNRSICCAAAYHCVEAVKEPAEKRAGRL
jgi:hypothetical protein